MCTHPMSLIRNPSSTLQTIMASRWFVKWESFIIHFQYPQSDKWIKDLMLSHHCFAWEIQWFCHHILQSIYLCKVVGHLLFNLLISLPIPLLANILSEIRIIITKIINIWPKVTGCIPWTACALALNYFNLSDIIPLSITMLAASLINILLQLFLIDFYMAYIWIYIWI